MKPTQMDVEALRGKILTQYSLVRKNMEMLRTVRGKDFAEMMSRLKKAQRTVDRVFQGMRLSEKKLRELGNEVQLLCSYFGAPTGRPLAADGVRFIDPYQQGQLLLFRMEPSPSIYVEMVRNSLALIEYQLPRGGDISGELRRLVRNLLLMDQVDDYNQVLYIHRGDLCFYLMELHKLLYPRFQASDHTALTGLIQRFYLAMAAALKYLECETPQNSETLCNALCLAVALMGRKAVWDPLDGFLVFMTVEFLWDYELDQEDREFMAAMHKRAQEVMGHA